MNFNELIKSISESDQNESLIIQAIEERVIDLLDKNPELLFSYMYRLDVEEKIIQAALHKTNPTPPYKALSKLIWERQKRRLEFKQKFKVKPIDDSEYI